MTHLDAAVTGFLVIIADIIFPPKETRDADGGPANDCLGILTGKPSIVFVSLDGPIDGLDIIWPALLFKVDWLIGPNVVLRLLMIKIFFFQNLNYLRNPNLHCNSSHTRRQCGSKPLILPRQKANDIKPQTRQLKARNHLKKPTVIFVTQFPFGGHFSLGMVSWIVTFYSSFKFSIDSHISTFASPSALVHSFLFLVKREDV